MLSFYMPEYSTLRDLRIKINETLSLKGVNYVFTQLLDEEVVGIVKDTDPVTKFTKKSYGINAYEIERLEDAADKCLTIVNFKVGRTSL